MTQPRNKRRLVSYQTDLPDAQETSPQVLSQKVKAPKAKRNSTDLAEPNTDTHKMVTFRAKRARKPRKARNDKTLRVADEQPKVTRVKGAGFSVEIVIRGLPNGV